MERQSLINILIYLYLCADSVSNSERAAPNTWKTLSSGLERISKGSGSGLIEDGILKYTCNDRAEETKTLDIIISNLADIRKRRLQNTGQKTIVLKPAR
jgi:hypothetical protein